MTASRSYAVRALEAIGEALSALSSPTGLRVLEGVGRMNDELGALLGPDVIRVRITTSAGPVTLEFGGGAE